MPAFHMAVETRRGAAAEHDAHALADQRWLALGSGVSDAAAFDLRLAELARAGLAPGGIRRALPGAEFCLGLRPVGVDGAGAHANGAQARLGLVASAAEGAWHYLRRADATVRALPAETGWLQLEPGDAYVAVTRGARRLAGSPAVAGFIHLRDYFNARRLATALLDELAAPGTEPEEDVTVAVVEAR